jgi:cation diffusion facilitator CzcD-associated flavoprotein CzcO
MCAGYYSYSEGHQPDFPGINRYQGTVIHPQFWPDDLDYRGKKVVVIGSGATAMTLVPAMAEEVAHITMLQRSPTYVVSRPDRDRIANGLRRILPARWAYAITRWKNVLAQQWVYHRTRVAPESVRKILLKRVREELGPDYDIDTHFTPRYNPWDQRLCLIPNSDLFAAIRSGKASVVTDRIATFEENGIRLASGEILEADIVVSATGLKLAVLGDIAVRIDGEVTDLAKTWSYKGVMYSDVPNLISTFGYINASWTLRADLTAEFACRLLNHMDEVGSDTVTPRLRPEDLEMPERDWIEDFSPGYMQRAMHQMPKQGDREPWLNPQNYRSDRKLFRHATLEDGALVFSSSETMEQQLEEQILKAAS